MQTHDKRLAGVTPPISGTVTSVAGAPGKNYIFEAKGGGVALLDYDQDGTFSDVSRGSGILGRYDYYGLGAAVGDFNSDSWPDIYVANDSCPNFLVLNKKNGTL